MFRLKSFFILLNLSLYLSNCQSITKHRFDSFTTSVFAMTSLVESELWLINTIQSLIDTRVCELQDERKGTALLGYLEKLTDEHQKSKDNHEAHLSNPLNSFTLIRRLYEVWPIIIYSLDDYEREYLKAAIEANNISIPRKGDFRDAAMGMERIRVTYNLKVADIADGILNGVQYDARLSNTDLYAIGLELYKEEVEADISAWINVSLHTKNLDVLPTEISGFNRVAANSLYRDTLVQQGRNQSFPEKDDDEIFETACRGENLTLNTGLFCRLNTSFNPFYLLAPMKMEELSLDPYVVIFHDFLQNDDILEMKYEAQGLLERARVFEEDEDKKESSKFDDIRTTHDAAFQLRYKIIQKVLAATGLDLYGFEYPTVLNYGLGGHYGLHHDYFHPLTDISMEYGFGDRIATAFMYLSEVEQGGATVFPKIGLSIKPKKGSLLLWYNLKSSGEADDNVLHGACPVIVGSKWAATIWIRERPQFRALPCYNP